MLLTSSIWSILDLIQYIFNVLTSSLYPSIFKCRPFCDLYSTVMVRYVTVQGLLNVHTYNIAVLMCLWYFIRLSYFRLYTVEWVEEWLTVDWKEAVTAQFEVQSHNLFRGKEENH